MQPLKERAALISIAVTVALTTSKLIAAFATGSLALLSDSLQSVIDVGATIMTWWSVRLAAKPADEQHQYGHGKVESITALIEVGLLFSTSIYVAIEAGRRLLAGGEPPTLSIAAAAVLVIAAAVDFNRVRALRRIARETASQALESNALHFAADMWQSIVVLVGFGAVAAGLPQGDALAAVVVASMVAVAALGLGRRAVNSLMDIAPEGAANTIREAAAGVSGVVAVERVRSRAVGATTHGEVLVSVPRGIAAGEIGAVSADVERAIGEALPGSEVTVTVAPRALDDETVIERVLMIAAVKRLPVHHVTVQQIGGRTAVALDLELDGAMRFDAAHAVASRLEAAVQEELGAETEVETHIEPMEPQGLPGREVRGPERDAMGERIAVLAAGHPRLGTVHDVRVRATEKGLIVVFHCHADPAMTVSEVHDAVDAFERDIRKARPDVVRVLTHAEPDC